MNNKAKLKEIEKNYVLIDSIHRSGKTQREIAKEIGMSTTNLSNVVNGKVCPSLVTALKISKAVGVDVNKLFSSILEKI